VGSVAFLFTIQYSALLSGVIHRKQKETYRVNQIDAMIKQVPSIKEKILAETDVNDEQKLNEDLELCESVGNME